jgi:hypothetical protein
MGETKISHEILKMIKKEFKNLLRITRHHCGIAKGFNGGFVNLGEPYWPDYIGFSADGRFVGIEIKDPNGRTNRKREEGQDKMLADIANAGGYAIKTDGVEDCRKKLLKIVLEIKKH